MSRIIFSRKLTEAQETKRALGATKRQAIQAKITELCKHPRDYGYSSDNADLFVTWTLGPILETRDSTLLTQSNSAEIQKRFKNLLDHERAEINHTGHFGYGWCDHLSFPVVEYTNVLHTRVPRESAAYRLWQQIQDDLNDYPILNEIDYGEREVEATLENIESAMWSHKHKILPPDYIDLLYAWFMDNDYAAIESCDDRGGYPDDDQLARAFAALGWIK